MSPRPRLRTALGGAAVGVVLLVLTWFAAFHIGFFERLDHTILVGFAGLHRGRVDGPAHFIAELCNPNPYVFLVAVPVLVALIRGRPRVAVMVGGVVLGANLTSQLLKPLLAAPRPSGMSGPFLDPASWPSGHATAVMTLVLCAVIVAPARWRPVVGALMSGFAIAVCYSFLTLTWHLPSDVLGGFEVAAVWVLLGVAALQGLEARHLARRPMAGEGRRPVVSVAEALAPMALLVVIGLLAAAVVVLARPALVVHYASAHKAFVVGAAAIAGLGLALTAAATLALRQN